MTKNEFVGGIPLRFKIIELSRTYELPCRECSWKDSRQKKVVRVAIFDGEWHNRFSKNIHEHDDWHDKHPNQSYDEFKKKQLAEASRQAMEFLSQALGRYFR
jgi:hypothetical protein